MSDPGLGFNFKRSLGSSCEIIVSKPDSPRDGRVEVKLWGASPAPERLLRASRCWPKGGEQAIKVAHRRLALMYHPDRNPGFAPKKNSKRPQRLATSERYRSPGRVLAWTRTRLSNEAVEGMNNKVKSISHRSLGLRSPSNCIATIDHCFARLPVPVEG